MEDTINPPKDDEKHLPQKGQATIEVEEEETMLPTMAHGGDKESKGCRRDEPDSVTAAFNAPG